MAAVCAAISSEGASGWGDAEPDGDRGGVEGAGMSPTRSTMSVTSGWPAALFNFSSRAGFKNVSC